jgi:hypothetical protein
MFHNEVKFSERASYLHMVKKKKMAQNTRGGRFQEFLHKIYPFFNTTIRHKLTEMDFHFIQVPVSGTDMCMLEADGQGSNSQQRKDFSLLHNVQTNSVDQ